MKYAMFVLLLIAAAAMLFVFRQPVPARPPRGYPVSVLASGKLMPSIGLYGPLAGWIPLPDKGEVIGVGIYPRQPPWGASATILLRFRSPVKEFVSSYRERLRRAGFPSHPRPFTSSPLDPVDASYEADEIGGGNTIYITARGAPATDYVQLTYWSAPAPR